MDAFDATGGRTDRRHAFPGSLPAYEEDAELQAIVAEASRDLDVPIAMVSLVLDDATDRRVSFRQLVTTDGRPLEVTDASGDPRVPRFLVRQYGVRAYLGMPVSANDVVVGALCVLSDEPRTFSDDDRNRLRALSARVNARLAVLARQPAPPSLREQSTVPALTALGRTLVPIDASARAGLAALEAMRPLVRLVDRLSRGSQIEPATLARTAAVAHDALHDAEDALCEVEASIGDAVASLDALERLFTTSPRSNLLSVALAGRELARAALAPVGGAFVSEGPDRWIATAQSLATSVVSAALTMLAGCVGAPATGLRVTLVDGPTWAGLRIAGPTLPSAVYRDVASTLAARLTTDPTLDVVADGDTVLLRFALSGTELPTAAPE